jgi:hypothetical protein
MRHASMTKVGERQSPMLQNECMKHFGFNGFGRRWYCFPANNQIVAVFELPDIPATSVPNWPAVAEIEILGQALTETALPGCSACRFADIDNLRVGYPTSFECGQADIRINPLEPATCTDL